ncbi:tRNA epoxyqueuosine(34) reductase QueG [Pseudoroseicyclus sp. CXY001]|uniref:tRNA epoxyqueuosine(34) reductase QueG n=1 Tax=Pseudoroseicyclus sp. CXY001 TaxID=3242492 RepID=UPI00358DB96E
MKAALRDFAFEAGFSGMGVCRPDAIPAAKDRLGAFLGEGRQGQMSWLEERAAWRGDPGALWPEAKSVIMLAEVYEPEDSLALLSERERGIVAGYARGKDYHDIVKKRLKRVGRWLLEQAAGEEIKVFVDTAPVMEKPLAEAAGLGWQGKHTNLLSRDLGNWFFLGAIFTTLELEPDAPEGEHCGSCTACLDICPTNAFPAPFQLDARRCISYLTIEHHGPVPEEFRPALGNRIFGCDDCLAICPWNKFAARAREARYAGEAAPELGALAALDEAGFRERFKGTPIRRLGHARLMRNVLYAIGNSGAPHLAAAARPHLESADPAVRDAAAWALSRLGDMGESADRVT